MDKSNKFFSTMKSKTARGFSTQCVHAGENREKSFRPLITPIYQTATYAFKDVEQLQEYYDGNAGNLVAEYGRYGNLTEISAQQKLMNLEKAKDCMLLPSGMSAITTLFSFFLKSGDHIIITNDHYRGTRKVLEKYFIPKGVQVSFTSVDIQEIKKCIIPETKIIFTEIPTNPLLYLLEVDTLANVCREMGIISIVDATLASPYNLRPLEFGIDYVVHSASKYLAGHNDLILGVICSNHVEQLTEVRNYSNLLGNHVDPLSMFLLLRGLKTFGLRMQCQNQSAKEIAHWLSTQKKIKKVHYLGNLAHPNHAWAKKNMRGYGGVISFEVGDCLADAISFCNALEIVSIGASLGGVESLVHPVRIMSFADVSDESLASYGISPNLLRLSVGIEEHTDLIYDLENALGEVS